MRSLLPVPFSSSPTQLSCVPVCVRACTHAGARSIRGRGSLPVAATATLGMLSYNLPDQTCQIVANGSRLPRRISAIISHHRCSRWGQSLLRHGQPSQHGGLIPLLRLLFLRLIPPGFLLTSQSIILLGLWGIGKTTDSTPACRAKLCVTQRQRPGASLAVTCPCCRQHPSRPDKCSFAQLAHHRRWQHPRAAAQRQIQTASGRDIRGTIHCFQAES